MKKLTVILLLITAGLTGYTQADTVPSQYKTFEPFSSYLQFSMGYNFPVGRYGKGDEPFRNAYAGTGYPNLSVNAAYGQKITSRLNFAIGAQFNRARFSNRAFKDAYIAKYGDTLIPDVFDYEHISLYAGIGYSYTNNRLNINFQGGLGGLYTVLNMDELDAKTVSGNSYFNRGIIETGKSLRPMFYAGADIKYYIGYDTYLFAGAFYTLSSFRQVITKSNPFYPYQPIGEFLKNDLVISNLAVNFGIGTVFR
ncbi:MAG TPA: hypothetical protein VEC12_02075 [Bacteroidia bacterium]|nr:hypothetical protein [Bacteroidia bacterium]